MEGSTTWQVDPAHTTVEFAVARVGHSVRIEIEAQAVKQEREEPVGAGARASEGTR
jgi:polyisoprenoid-binding protein YceI